MKTVRGKTVVAVSMLLSLASWSFAGELRGPTLQEPPPAVAEFTELSLGNFFSAGWNEPWSRRPRPDGAPDLTLLRVQSNMLLRALRTDYSLERPLETSSERRVQTVNQLIEYSFNRRLMIALIGNYEWIDARTGEDESGWTYGALARFQLVDTCRSSYALNFRAMAPNHELGEKKTTLSFALAGWHDLTPLGLDRMGLYWHVQEITYLGPRAPGAKANDLTYAVSLAKTWTGSDATFGNLTTFVETYARTDLDGENAGRTTVTLTPGVRCTFAHRHTLIAGIDLPLSTPRPNEQLFRLTYVFSF